MRMKKGRRRFWVRIAGEVSCFFAFWCLLFAVWLQAFPVVEDGLLVYPDADEMEHVTLPLEYRNHVGVVPVQLSIAFHRIHFTHLRLVPDDCIRSLEINNVHIAIPEEQSCDYFSGITIDASEVIKPGKNIFFVRLFNEGGIGGLRLQPTVSDPLHYVVLLLLAVSATIFFYRIRRLGIWNTKASYAMFALLFFAIALRFFYVVGTPYTLRAYDVMGHIEYIDFLLGNKRLPVMGDGWQWYQPPLYYFAMAGIAWFYQWQSAPMQNAYIAMQWASFVASICTLVVLLRIGKQMLDDQNQKKQFALYAVIISTCPALVYYAARINNDVFLLLFSVIAFYALLQWWFQKKPWQWYGAIFACCIAYLSKGNAIVMFATAATLLLLQSGMTWKQKWTLAWKSALLIIFCLEWIVAFRLLTYGDKGLVGNAGSLNEDLQLTTTVQHLLTFNPIQVLDHPFAHPWLDEERRQYFLEYLYKSAFFGEFSATDDLRSLAVAILLVAMTTIPLLLWGTVYSCWKRWRHDAPMIVLSVYILAAHLFFRISYPFSSSQDFRYSVLLVMPVTYFMVTNLHRCPKRIRQFYTAILVLIAVCTSAFLLQLLMTDDLGLF